MVWILTADAVTDLDQISMEGARRFGANQAAHYEIQLVSTFDLLAANPYMAAPHEVDGMQLRLMPSGRHHILYVIENEDVVLLRVLHALQNWQDLL